MSVRWGALAVLAALAATSLHVPALRAQGLRGAIHPEGESPAPKKTPAPKPKPRTPAAEAQARPPAPPPKPGDAFLLYYPEAARTAGIEGEAVVRCARGEHLALTGCTLVSETPAGQGFGAAALAMARLSLDNPKIDDPTAKSAPAQDLKVRFSLHPPAIDPDLTQMAHRASRPELLVQPTDEQIKAAYPTRALDDQVSGGAKIACVVTAAGRLAECQIAEESPPGYGFGAAALDLAGDFAFKPGTADGEPVRGFPVKVSVAFTSGDPAAPLSLDARPAPK